ncbi:MAG TPA: MBL fold metallo-hydrolase [Myxococcota bacterium]|nr:MBL fold metallo-hydrolase [Myxococcota bacterium]
MLARGFPSVGRALAVIAVLTSSACFWAAPGHRGPTSQHFDGREFSNLGRRDVHGFAKAMWLFAFTHRDAWGHRDIQPSVPPRRVGQGELRITFVNHATMLMQFDGLNVVTDPVYSDLVGPVSFAGVRRLHDPGVALADLPPIDAVLVSHNHYDHMDMPTLRTLSHNHAPRIFAGLGSKHLLDEHGVLGGEDLDWWETSELAPGIRVTAVPVRHWSRRGVGDTDNTLWCGFVIETSRGPVYFAGDTGFGEHFHMAYERFGPMRAAMLPIGSYKPQSYMHISHMSPDAALEAHLQLASSLSIAMHFGSFQLAFDDQGEAEARLLAEAERRGIPGFVVLAPGETRVIGAVDR